MNENKVVMAMRFSAVVFGMIGLCLGFIFFKHAATAFAVLGVTFGTLVGVVAAVYCLVINRRNCVSLASLIGNLVLFIIVAREMQIIG